VICKLMELMKVGSAKKHCEEDNSPSDDGVACALSTASPWIAFISSLVSSEHASTGALADERAGDEGDGSACALGGEGVSDFEQPEKAAKRHANNERRELRIKSGPPILHSLGRRATRVQNESPFSRSNF
jgi:hypothetical protein